MNSFRIIEGDALDILASLPAVSVDSMVTDPPAGISFMGKTWDTFTPSYLDKMDDREATRKTLGPHSGSRPGRTAPRSSSAYGNRAGHAGTYDPKGREVFIKAMRAIFVESLRVLKPGAHALVWTIPRTSHWTVTALEDAGFEIRDVVVHLFGTGFPKSLDVGKAIDKRGGYPHLAGEIGRALKRAREDRGLSAGWCDKKFCNGSTNWSWFEGRPSGQRAPTPEMFSLIVREWPEVAHLAAMIDQAEREKVGEGYRVRRQSVVQIAGESDGAYDLTAPATEAARQWEGWGTALKPAAEHWILCRKPLIGTVAGNVIEHGTGALNIDGCRMGTGADKIGGGCTAAWYPTGLGKSGPGAGVDRSTGRWPANVVLSHAEGCGDDCAPECPVRMLDEQSGESVSNFFYCAKPSTAERNVGQTDNRHPTVKAVELMQYFCRLITPPGGTVLDPFAGSGSTGIAALREGFDFIGIEREAEYIELARHRIKGDAPLFNFEEQNIAETPHAHVSRGKDGD